MAKENIIKMNQERLKANKALIKKKNKNEIYLVPNFGANLRAFIFEQITSGNLDFLKENIQSLIIQYFPNIRVELLNILQSSDTNEINVQLTYSIINTGVTDQVQITFQ